MMLFLARLAFKITLESLYSKYKTLSKNLFTFPPVPHMFEALLRRIKLLKAPYFPLGSPHVIRASNAFADSLERNKGHQINLLVTQRQIVRRNGSVVKCERRLWMCRGPENLLQFSSDSSRWVWECGWRRSWRYFGHEATRSFVELLESGVRFVLSSWASCRYCVVKERSTKLRCGRILLIAESIKRKSAWMRNRPQHP